MTSELQEDKKPSQLGFLVMLLIILSILLELDSESASELHFHSTESSSSPLLLMSKEHVLWRSNVENVAAFTATQCTIKGPEEGSVLELSMEYTFMITASPHQFSSLFSQDTSRPAAGAHFEVLLHSHQFRYRPLIEDMNDGNYTLTISVPGFSWLAGRYTLEIYLLCSGGGGVANDHFVGPSLVDVRSLDFVRVNSMNPPDHPCGLEIWKQPVWSGYWIIQPAMSLSDAVGYERQFQETIMPLLDDPKIFPSNPNRWIYRLKTCFFPVRAASRSQFYINSSWIFMHGDSNMQDTTRNLALNALQLIEDSAALSLLHSSPISLRTVDRTSDLILHNDSMHYRSSIINNGAYPPSYNYQGLLVYNNPDFLKSLKDAWMKEVPSPYGHPFHYPSLMYVNDAALHGAQDTWGPVGLISYIGMFHDATLPALEDLHRLSMKVMSNVTNQLQKQTMWLWRTTITPAGNSRIMPANPHKVEILNHLIVQEVQEHSRKDQHNIQWSFIDAFDITYPWHFDNSLSDGGHYGRYGNSMVDDMLVQVLLHFYFSQG